jgi:uncharacterized protein with ParB-like and HNH nuclease domain
VEFDISVAPSDPTLELLAQQIQKGDIFIPPYQRRYVWSIEQASKLIESFLMGLPVPQVFLYVNHENQLEVIDGQQRLMSIRYFLEGFFGEEDDKEKRQVFKLKGLAQRSEYNDKTFSELQPKDQRKLKNSTLRAINIRQIKPLTNDSVFHIFERLNTGGTRLKPQEIRNAVYRGQVVTELNNLNKIESWRSILGLRKPDKNQKDVELILRLFSLFRTWKSYEKPMLKYLNHSMDQNRNFDDKRAIEFIEKFPAAVKLVNLTLTKPFRPRGVINSAVLEAVMVSILESDSMSAKQLANGYNKLLSNDEFLNSITGGTTDTGVLTKRIAIAKDVFGNEPA